MTVIGKHGGDTDVPHVLCAQGGSSHVGPAVGKCLPSHPLTEGVSCHSLPMEKVTAEATVPGEGWLAPNADGLTTGRAGTSSWM